MVASPVEPIGEEFSSALEADRPGGSSPVVSEDGMSDVDDEGDKRNLAAAHVDQGEDCKQALQRTAVVYDDYFETPPVE